MKLKLAILALTALSFSGCTSSVTPSALAPKAQHYANYDNAPSYKIEKFSKAQHAVGLSIKNDPKYKSFKPVLTTDEKRDWFNNLMYLLWDRQITRNQYIDKGTSKLPAYKYEFTSIANRF